MSIKETYTTLLKQYPDHALSIIRRAEEEDIKDIIIENRGRFSGLSVNALKAELISMDSEGNLPRPFGLYKEKDNDIELPQWWAGHLCRMDFVNNSVKVIIAELDGDKSADYESIPEEMINIFNRFKQDEEILFSYISTSGGGIRFGFKVDEEITNEAEYLTNLYYYAKVFKKRHDHNDYLDMDYCCLGEFPYEGDLLGGPLLTHARTYWWPPINGYVSYNDQVKVLPLV